jgi:hypothetical protein
MYKQFSTLNAQRISQTQQVRQPRYIEINTTSDFDYDGENLYLELSHYEGNEVKICKDYTNVLYQHIFNLMTNDEIDYIIEGDLIRDTRWEGYRNDGKYIFINNKFYDLYDLIDEEGSLYPQISYPTYPLSIHKEHIKHNSISFIELTNSIKNDIVNDLKWRDDVIDVENDRNNTTYLSFALEDEKAIVVFSVQHMFDEEFEIDDVCADDYGTIIGDKDRVEEIKTKIKASVVKLVNKATMFVVEDAIDHDYVINNEFIKSQMYPQHKFYVVTGVYNDKKYKKYTPIEECFDISKYY